MTNQIGTCKCLNLQRAVIGGSNEIAQCKDCGQLFLLKPYEISVTLGRPAKSDSKIGGE